MLSKTKYRPSSGKRICLLFCFSFFILNAAFGQRGTWTWISGDSAANSNGVFGIQGIPSPSNKPPALYEPCQWTDLNGNFWLYGGESNNGTLNDLWKYNPTNNEWMWMTGTHNDNDSGNYGIQGVASSANRPPSKGWGTLSWTDLDGNLWMFGGSADNSRFSDLWKYDISINEWTWMKGPNSINQPSIYGIKGVPNTLNNPGNRCETSASWVDNSGDLWLFGGYWRYLICLDRRPHPCPSPQGATVYPHL